jgi:predicted nucleic acid-binding protein
LSYVLHTTVLIDLLRGNPHAGAFLASLGGQALCSEVTRIEVLRGMRDDEREATLQLLGAIGWRAVDVPIARRAGDLGRKYLGSHGAIHVADLAVAATAELSALPLATSNVKHFPMFEGLEPAYR